MKPNMRLLATRSRVLGPCVVLALAIVTPALGAWNERPARSELLRFARAVDSVAVWSVTLPDSATVGKRRDAEVLDVAGVRAQVVLPRSPGRELAEALFANRAPDGFCDCDLVRDDADTADVVIPVAQFFVDDEVMWIPIVFRDSCAQVFLPQGPWGGLPIRANRPELLRLVREALPGDTAFASDRVPPRRQRKPPIELQITELPEELVKSAPDYPEAALAQGLHGVVLVRALIGREGTVRDTYIGWSVPYLDDAAREAVSQWRFKPARLHGKPVEVWVTVPVKFSLR